MEKIASFTQMLKSRAECVRIARDEYKTAKANKANIMADSAIVKRILGDYKPKFIYSRIDYNGRVSIGIDMRVNGFKDPVLMALLDRACDSAKAEWTDDCTQKDYASRTFAFHLPNGGDFRINAELQGDGETCRIVQVGEKVRTEPVFAIQCD